MAKRTNRKTRLQSFFQYGFLLLFLFLISIAVFPPKEDIPLDIFLRIDPLIAIGTSLATLEVVDKAYIALAVLIVTVLLGRIFCGYICPLGAAIDISEDLFLRKKKKKAPADQPDGIRKYTVFKYYGLTVILASSLFGLTVLYIFDPISLFTRTVTTVFYPLVIYLSNVFLDLIRPLSNALDFVGLSHKYYIQPLFGSNLIIFLMFCGILYLSTVRSRFWCRYLCPLGALLGLCSKAAVLKRGVSDDCNRCGLCDRDCPMGAIDNVSKQSLQSECIQCRQCEQICPKEAIRFQYKPENNAGNDRVNLTRRALVTSIGAGVTLSLLGKTNVGRANAEIIRPPGAIPEEEFLQRCIRCGECIKACITNTLQPSLFESGFEGVWTPVHHMRHAGCEQQCNLCGQVCPTQAIRSLPLRERKYARVGTAVITRDRCLAWEQNKLCIICDEQCPYNAIVFRNVDGHKRPFVDETKCNGCGICEQKCPVAGSSAITVAPIGELRLKTGSYIKKAERQKLIFQEEKDDLYDSGSEYTSAPPSTPEPAKIKLPPGFIMK